MRVCRFPEPTDWNSPINRPPPLLLAAGVGVAGTTGTGAAAGAAVTADVAATDPCLLMLGLTPVCDAEVVLWLLCVRP